jgi:hypothetical protein
VSWKEKEIAPTLTRVNEPFAFPKFVRFRLESR